MTGPYADRDRNDLEAVLERLDALERRLDGIERHLALITGFGLDELLLLRRLKEHPKMIPWLKEFVEAPNDAKEKTMRVWAAFLPDEQYWAYYHRLREELGLTKKRGEGEKREEGNKK
ncbi:MAG: hypothetical protein KM312_05460 [Hydrogenibacillus schlegelii]|uniref:Uncharacterized protein n=1 Tax=Hydrogenibacillus schlegelii TaxID=1484 RepID=A0A947CW29_HYDSH|nr:hypothetical protein [Hydrogenibacillus schlegelii]